MTGPSWPRSSTPLSPCPPPSVTYQQTNSTPSSPEPSKTSSQHLMCVTTVRNGRRITSSNYERAVPLWMQLGSGKQDAYIRGCYDDSNISV